MIKDIKSKISTILHLFQLSLEEFSEDKDNFYISKDCVLKEIDTTKLLESCSYFKGSIKITMRNLDTVYIKGDSLHEELTEFETWIGQNIGNDIVLTISLAKNDFLDEEFKSYNNLNACIYFKLITFKLSLTYEKIKTDLLINSNHTMVILPFYEFTQVSNKFLTILGIDGNPLMLTINENNLEIELEIKDKTQKQKLYCNMGNVFEDIIPDYFYFENQPVVDIHGIFSSINHLLFLLCIHYIANLSNKESFYIHGYKNVHIDAKEFDSKINNEDAALAYQLYDSIYDVQTQDKLLITRNVISIHLPNESKLNEFILLLPELFSSVTSNFDSYIKDKIKSFFDKKKDLEKYVRDTSEAISKQIASASDNLNKSWLTLAGAVLAGIITYTTRGNSLLLIFFVAAFGIISYVTLRHSIWIAKEEKTLLLASYQHFLSLVDVINEDEIKEITGDIVKDKFNLLDKTIKKMDLFKAFLPFILLIAIVILLCLNKTLK